MVLGLSQVRGWVFLERKTPLALDACALAAMNLEAIEGTDALESWGLALCERRGMGLRTWGCWGVN